MRLMTLTLAASLMAGSALAQAGPDARDPNMPDPRNTIPEKIEPRDPATTGSVGADETLSNRLNRTDGVIRPPMGTTPDMSITPPDTGTTPVIPPPGAPGGNQAIQPK